ncbi:hypothetical protein P3L10_001423 [Capsicum annuum]
MIENLEEHVIRLEESIKDVVDFVKDERLRRTEKENQKKRNEIEGVEVQSQNSARGLFAVTTALKKLSLR